MKKSGEQKAGILKAAHWKPSGSPIGSSLQVAGRVQKTQEFGSGEQSSKQLDMTRT